MTSGPDRSSQDAVFTFATSRRGAFTRGYRASKRAAREAAWILAGNVLRTVVQFGVLLFVVRVEGVAQAGQLAFALALTAPLFVLAQMGLREVYLTATWAVSLRQVQVLRAAGVLIALVVSCAIGAVQDVSPLPVVFVVSLVKAIDTYAEVFSGALQEGGRARWIGYSLLLNALVTAVSAGSVLALNGGLVPALAVSAAVSVIANWVVLRRGLRRVLPSERQRDSGPSVLRVLRSGASLGVSSSLNSLLFSMPIFFLGYFADDRAVGLFAPLAYVITGANLVFGACTQVLLPRLARTASRGGPDATRTQVLKTLPLLLVMAMILAGPVALMGRSVVGALFGEAFSEGLSNGVFIALGVALIAVPVTQVCTAGSLSLTRYRQLVPYSALAFGITFALGWLLVPRLGLVGAAILLACSLYARAGLSAWAFICHVKLIPAHSRLRP